MKKNIVNRDIALRLKGKGFNAECLYHYTNDGCLRPNYVHPVGGEYTLEGAWGCCNELFSDKTCDAPTIDQILEWFWDKYKIHMSTTPHFSKSNYEQKWLYNIIVYNPSFGCVFTEKQGRDFSSSDEAALEGMIWVLDYFDMA